MVCYTNIRNRRAADVNQSVILIGKFFHHMQTVVPDITSSGNIGFIDGIA